MKTWNFAGFATITKTDIACLDHNDRIGLLEWTLEQAGGKQRDFLPAAVRRLPLDTRLALSQSEALTERWQARESQRVSESVHYFVEQYGHVQPPKGKPIPFVLWPCQVPVLAFIDDHEQTVFPKARRMGISWLVMHYIDWTCEHNPATPNARCLIMSKGLDDAKEMLKRVNRINELQPTWLRREPSGADNTQEMDWGGSSVRSLPATERAARSETATLVVLDEEAFIPNGQAEDIEGAVEPTIEGGGKIVRMSSGNGEVGDGAEFARICRASEKGQHDAKMLFLPADARPDRSAEFIARKRLQSDKAKVEYALTLDEALQGDMTIHVYSRSWIAAAEVLGMRLRSYDKLVYYVEQGIEWGTDWGDFQTVTVYAVPLPGGGVYIMDELVQPHIEPEQSSTNIIRHDPAGIRHPDGGKARAVRSNQDASPAGTNATFAAVLRRHREMPEYAGRIPEQAVRIPFGLYKQGGKGAHTESATGRADTIGFNKWLFQRTHKFIEADKDLDAMHGVIGVDPRCTLLLSQLRNLERDPETGKVKKPPLDPKRPEIGDHGPDALVALNAIPRAVHWTAQEYNDDES